MLANELTPFCPTHPGEILKDEVEYRKISQRALARQMGISFIQLRLNISPGYVGTEVSSFASIVILYLFIMVRQFYNITYTYDRFSICYNSHSKLYAVF